MRKILLVLTCILVFFTSPFQLNAQNSQTVTNGSQTNPINFNGPGCTYNWVNNNPAIGLPASGTGNIAAFTAVNTGNTPVTATITATPASNGFIYTADPYFNSVTVINATTNALVTYIQVQGGPCGLSLSPDGSRLYVVNTESASISVINTSTNQVISTIQVGSYPYGVVVSPDGNTVYVANQVSNSVSVINAKTNIVTSTIKLTKAGPWCITISLDGSELFLTDYNSNSMLTVNTANQAIKSVTVGTTPIGISQGSSTKLIYVANFGSANVSVVNVLTNTVVGTIPVGEAPMGIAINAVGTKVYVTNSGSNSVSVIDAVTNKVIATIPVGLSPEGISISPDGSLVYVMNTDDNTMSVISTTSNSVLATPSVRNGQYSIGNFVSGCSPVTYTITVNPTPPPSIATSTASGNISACVGTVSSSPYLEQFSVSGSNLTAPVTATAPTGFEVSLAAGSGFSSSVQVSPVTGSISGTTIYVRSAAADAVGNISGNVVLSSAGAANQLAAVTGVVNALPTVNQPGDQTVANGAATTAVNFTGTGNIFNWTNDTPGIGLAASGTGNIPSFTAINTGNTPVTAKITVASVNQQAQYEYITDETANQVSVISNATNTIVSTIDVGEGPYGIALSPDGGMAYVSNYLGSSVSVINTTTNQVVATIPVTYNPIGIAVSPDGSKVYVCDFLGVSVIDATKNQFITGILIGNYIATGITVSPDGKWIYVADVNNNALVIINASTYQQIRVSIPTGIEDSAFNVAVSPDDSLVYVTGGNTNNIYVISAISQTVVKTINLNASLVGGIVISPDGNRIYATNEFSNMVSVVDAQSGNLITTITVGNSPEGISVSPDGGTVYVANVGSNNMSIINTSNNQVIATVAAGSNPHSLGNFIKSSISCGGPPATFTITVNPTPVPYITASLASGNITACAGTASVSPDIQQFTVSGNNLTTNITAMAPTGFEISLNDATGYSSSLTLAPNSGTVNSAIIYIRSSATAAAGTISNTVVLTSAGAANQSVAASGIINPIPAVNAVPTQTPVNGATTTAINFTGTADSYTWINDTPGIGLSASGTGDIPSFTVINNTASPITATVTVTPLNNSGCDGTPVKFTIIAEPTPPPIAITATSTLTPLTTIYGTPSPTESFTVSGTNITAGISATPPTGFEVSSDGVSFNPSVTISGTGNIAPLPVYIRLAATTPVGGYGGDIALSSTNAPEVNVEMPTSFVTPAALTITADNKTKPYGAVNPDLTVTYNGFVNNDGPPQLTVQPNVTTTAITQSAVGQYPIIASGAVSANYNFTYIPGILTIVPSLSLLSIPNTFTPNGDNINDTWEIKYLEYYPKATVNIFNRYGQQLFSSVGYPNPWDGKYHGKALPSGTYYYIIDPKNGQAVIAGWVAIIR